MSWLDLEPLSDAELERAAGLTWRPKPHRRDYAERWTVVELPALGLVSDSMTELDARLIANLPRLAAEVLRLRAARQKATGQAS